MAIGRGLGPATRGLAASVLATLAAAAVQAQGAPPAFPGFAALEAEMAKAGYVPLTGLIPPDVLVPRMVWREAPMAGVAISREPVRLATQAERLGEWDAARSRWAAIAADPEASVAVREEAGLAVVRLNVTRDPAAAQAALQALPPAAQSSVGGRILEARILAMEGKAAEALALLASQLLPALRLSSLHAEQLADEMSLAAMLAGERTLGERLASGGGTSAARFLPDLPLPRCHPDEGLAPGDRAILELSVDPLGELSRATPVWASRPGPMAETLARRALDGNVDLERTPKVEGAFLKARVAVGCAPHDLLATPRPGGSSMAELGPDGFPRPIAGLRPLEALPRATSATQAWERIEAADIPRPAQMLVLGGLVQRAGPQPDLCGAAERHASASAGLDFEGRLALAAALQHCDSKEAAARLLAEAAEDPARPAADRRGAAARAAALGADPAFRARMAAIAGLPPDSCLLTDDQALKGLAVEPDDYPPALRRLSIEGSQRIALARAADGAVTGMTTLIAQPPLLFDEANAALLERNRPLPAVRDGKPVACGGHVTHVRWQLATDEEGEGALP